MILASLVIAGGLVCAWRLRQRRREPVMPRAVQQDLRRLPDDLADELDSSWSDRVAEQTASLEAKMYKDPRKLAKRIVSDAYLAFIREYVDGFIAHDDWRLALELQIIEQAQEAATNPGRYRSFRVTVEFRSAEEGD